MSFGWAGRNPERATSSFLGPRTPSMLVLVLLLFPLMHPSLARTPVSLDELTVSDVAPGMDRATVERLCANKIDAPDVFFENGRASSVSGLQLKSGTRALLQRGDRVASLLRTLGSPQRSEPLDDSVSEVNGRAFYYQRKRLVLKVTVDTGGIIVAFDLYRLADDKTR